MRRPAIFHAGAPAEKTLDLLYYIPLPGVAELLTEPTRVDLLNNQPLTH
jgi:hypothetical protein